MDSNTHLGVGSLPSEDSDNILPDMSDKDVTSRDSGIPFILEETTAIGTSSMVTTHDDTKKLDDEDANGASKNLILANSLYNECLAHISQPSLESTIFLFRRILDEATSDQPLYSGTLRNLTLALGLKYLCMKEEATLLELSTLGERMKETTAINSGSNAVKDNDNLREMLTKGETAFENRVAALTTLAWAKYLQYHHSEMTSDLTTIASILQDARIVDQELGQIGDILRLVGVTLRLSIPQEGTPSRRKAGLIRESPFAPLINYGRNLLQGFETNGNMEDLENSVYLLRLGLTKFSIDSINYATRISNLATALQYRYEQKGNPQDLEEFVSLYRQALDKFQPSPHSDQSMYLNNLATGLLTRFQQHGHPQDLDESILLYRQALELRLSPHSLRSTSLSNLATGLCTRFEQRGNLQDLDDSISLLREALELLPTPHSDRSVVLNNLANGLFTKFEQRSNLQDLNESISLHRQALELRPSPHPLQSSSLSNLATGLYTRFEQQGNLQDLDDSISLHRHGLDLLHSLHPNRSSALNNLATGLSTRFEQRGNPEDLDDSISLHKQALELLPSLHPNRSSSLNNLAGVLRTRFEERSDPQGLDDSISFHRQALELQPPPHSLRSSSLTNLAGGLHARFQQQGNRQDLDESISLEREALTLTPSPHSGRSMSLFNLAGGLYIRFGQQGNPQDLDDSISLHRQALELRLPPHSLRSSSLTDLANILLTRFEQEGNRQDLDESISNHRQALALMPSPHSLRPKTLSSLANGLHARFKQQGNPQDLDDSISLHRQALELQRFDHSDRHGSLANLANVLHTRFEQRDNAQDVDESISLHRKVLEFYPSPHLFRSTSLNNLANGLSARFTERGNSPDLDESISLYKQALELLPSAHPGRSMSVNSLAKGLFNRFQQQGNPQDLDDSVSLVRQALELRPSPHPDRLMLLSNLANGLTIRFNHSSDTIDFHAAIKFFTECMNLLPADHPSRTDYFANFATLYLFAYTKGPLDTTHLDKVMELFSEAGHSASASPSHRYRRARTWALNASKYHHPSAPQAFDLAVGLMPEVVALGLDVQSRQDILAKNTDGLARGAAQCAIRLLDFGKAVEFLETGRSVFWSQFLSLRSPLDELEASSPSLAADLRSISRQLENGSHRDPINGNLSNGEKLALETEASNYAKLAQNWEDKIFEVRRLEGFQDFLRPQRFSTLQTAARGGPIIYLVANDDTSDCLAITTSTVHHIPLPKLPSPVLAALVQLVKVAASDRHVSRALIESVMENLTDDLPLAPTLRQLMEEDRGMRPETGIPKHISSDDVFRDVLGTIWDGAVKPVIDVLGLTKSDKPPKLTWCATGLFTFLPIHAAGRYNKGTVDCAPEYFTSSYTPTIEALLTPDPPSLESFEMMAIIQSQNLPSTRKELLRIEQHVDSQSLIKFGAAASVERVAARLATASIVHFACHGKQDSANPLQSGLEIGGERLTIARIMKESVPNGSLAFLSACETAMGDEKIPDEAMNIASSLLFTGFRRVVATMWRMWDEDGPVIADVFYRELFKGPDGSPMKVPDTSKSAEALWTATKELRARGVEFRRWVPFIHIGK